MSFKSQLPSFMKSKTSLLFLGFALLFSACSVVKSPTASNNFKRVKYRANLKLSKSDSQKQLTIASFEIEDKVEKSQEYWKPMVKKPFKRDSLNLYRKAVLAEQNQNYNIFQKEEQKKLLNDVKVLEGKVKESLVTTNDPWWESDPEDWPWKEIMLAAIVVLLVILAIYLLVSFLGGVVGGIVGLILLLALLYLIFDYYG